MQQLYTQGEDSSVWMIVRNEPPFSTHKLNLFHGISHFVRKRPLIKKGFKKSISAPTSVFLVEVHIAASPCGMLQQAGALTKLLVCESKSTNKVSYRQAYNQKRTFMQIRSTRKVVHLRTSIIL